MSLQLVRKDITQVEADAIVASVNSEPIVGFGVDKAIFEVAGYNQLLSERKKLGSLEVGKAGVTPAFNLPAKIVIHSVCPMWENGKNNELDMLYETYLLIFDIAGRYNCESIALPLLGTGVSGIPCDIAVQVAMDAIGKILEEMDIRVYLVIKDDSLFVLPNYISSGNETCKEWKERIGFKYSVLLRNDNKNVSKESKDKIPSGTVVDRIPISSGSFIHLPVKKPPQDPPQRAIQVPIKRFPQEPPKRRDDNCVRIPSTFYNQRTIEDVLAEKSSSFQQMLWMYIDRKGMTDVEVYRKANIDRKLFSKIRCNEGYKPGKRTIVALAIALELHISETVDLLARAELAFSPCNPFDKIVRYYIENQVYDIYTINLMLFKLGLPILGE